MKEHSLKTSTIVCLLFITGWAAEIKAQDVELSRFYTIGAKVRTVKKTPTLNCNIDSIADDEDETSEDNIADVNTDSIDRYFPKVALPLKDIKVTSPFGMRRDPMNRKSRRMHNGLDLKAHYESVFSMLPGIVSRTGYSKTGGYFVTVNHGVCVCSYLHLSKIKVVTGQHVKAGQTIAISGNTGSRTTGPHLHLACRLGDEKGKFFNPVVILNFVLEKLLVN